MNRIGLCGAISNGMTDDTNAYINTFFCSSCGLCEMYSCGQGLSPASLIAKTKGMLRQGGVAVPKGVELEPVHSQRDFRRVPMGRLTARLGLTKYNVPAPLKDEVVLAESVKVMLSQSIGAPSVLNVKVGDSVKVGDAIGVAPEGKLGVAVHASINGIVTEANDKFVVIQAKA